MNSINTVVVPESDQKEKRGGNSQERKISIKSHTQSCINF